MAFILQDDTGTVVGANAYGSYADFVTYHTDRGNTLGSYDQVHIERAIVQATDYIDTRFNYIGRKRNQDQATEWPRNDAWDKNRFYISDIPQAVKEACFEYAFRALSGELNPDPDRESTGATIASKSEKVGPISESVEYTGGGRFTMPTYPLADSKLKKPGLVLSGSMSVRG